MNKWEYTELDLNQVPKRMASIDLLNEAGIQGWELINITVTNRAILKLLVPDTPCKQPPKPRLVSPQVRQTLGGTAALMPRLDRV